MFLAMLQLPLVLIIIVMSVIWMVLMGIISIFCKLSLAAPPLRPVSFALALPFLLLGDILTTIAPCPTPADAESKEVKWRFIEMFPYSLQSF